jgi:DNA-directed RNA polymerase III subunit RPC8
MFVLTVISDEIAVHPSQFALPRTQALLDAINQKYSYRIVPDVGLALQVFDITSATEPVVNACQNGSYSCSVVFRLVVFRPAKGQILVGQIKECDKLKGIKGFNH